MKKENALYGNVGDLNGRITRARAAAIHASSKMSQLTAAIGQDKKRILRANPKRAAVEENSTSANENALVQCKRRAVLQDVTNVCCETSYGSCFKATKLQAKNGKQAKKGQLYVSKVAPSVAAKLPHLRAKSEVEIVPQMIKTEPKSEALCSSAMGEEVVPHSSSTGQFGTNDHQIPNQSVPSQHLSPPNKGIKEGRSGGGEVQVCNLILQGEEHKSSENGSIPSDPDFTDIDCDLKDPQLCSLYAADIYGNLRVAELIRRPRPTFMETVQHDITQSMRGILVDWLVEVSEEYKLVPDTLHLTVYLIDWFLSQNYIERHRLQLLGITCMLIASKFEEICAPRVEDFCFITDNTYTREEVLKMENRVLKYFGFQLFAPTAKSFLRRFLRAAQASYKSLSYELEYLANYLAELTLVDYSFLNFLPSLIAASSVFLAKWTLDQTNHPWNPTLEHYTSYKASHLKNAVLALQDLQLNASGCPLNAVRMKYRQQKFKSVAALSSPKVLETLF